MNDIKIFANNEKEQEALLQTIRIYSKVIRMEFGIEKYTIFIMKKLKEKQRKESNSPIKNE